MLFSVVVPAYNEEKGVQETIRRLLETKDEILKLPGINEIEIIVVNDGSTDHTKEAVSLFKDVVLIDHKENKGYGTSLKTGFEHSRGDIVGYLDADATYHPESFPLLITALLSSGYDMVIGSRMSGEKSEMPFLRSIGNIFFSLLLRLLFGARLSDVTSGMRVLKRTVFGRLGTLPDGFEFTIALSVRGLLSGMKVKEIAIPYDTRMGISKLKPALDGFRFLKTVTESLFKKKGWRL